MVTPSTGNRCTPWQDHSRPTLAELALPSSLGPAFHYSWVYSTWRRRSGSCPRTWPWWWAETRTPGWEQMRCLKTIQVVFSNSPVVSPAYQPSCFLLVLSNPLIHIEEGRLRTKIRCRHKETLSPFLNLLYIHNAIGAFGTGSVVHASSPPPPLVSWIKIRVLYIGKYPPPPGGKYQLMSFWGKNMKRWREKGGKCKRKRKKGKREGKKWERKWEKGK